MRDPTSRLAAALAERFGERFDIPETDGIDALARMADHRTMRTFADRPVPESLVRLLCAVALSAPTKSDLQQADILIVADPAARARLDMLCGENPWVRAAPVFLVFLANNRRQRRVHALRGHVFANDHLDAFFNAGIDAGIVLSAFVTAAEAAGLGTCPVSAIRNRPAEVASLLGLPERVFPVAGLCLGWPAHPGAISPRLPPSLRVHKDRYGEGDLDGAIAAYDKRRNRTRPYAIPRDPDRFGAVADYGWSEDKARQYAASERADFGAYIRRIGFRLD